MGLFRKNKTSKLYDKAIEFEKSGNMVESMKCYDQIIEINSNESMAWRGKGLIWNIRGKYDSAIACFDKAIEIDPDDTLAQKCKQDSLKIIEQENTYESERKEFELEDKFFKLKKKCFDLIIERNYEDAVVCIDEALRTHPNDADLWSSKGDALTEINREEEGLQCYDKSLEIDPDNPKVWGQKGMQLLVLNRLDEATICIDKSLEIDPDDPFTIMSKDSLDKEKIKIIVDLGEEGKELFKLKKYDEALQCFKKAATSDYLDADQKDAFESMIKLCLSKLNKSQDENTPEPAVSSSDDDPLKILKMRLAKGEITLEEFNEIKENLE